MKSPKPTKKKSANDNRHDPFMWELMHDYLDLWFEINQMPRTNFNRALHYAYEMKNRPWLPEGDCTSDVIYWLDKEAADLGIKVIGPTLEDLKHRR